MSESRPESKRFTRNNRGQKPKVHGSWKETGTNQKTRERADVELPFFDTKYFYPLDCPHITAVDRTRG